MENKIKTINIKDICPEGYKLDREKSTLNNLVFIKNEDYDYVCYELFYKKPGYYYDGCGHIKNINTIGSGCENYPNNCTSEKQAKKLLAINMLLNVAKYLNEGWQPNWNNEDEKKYVIYLGIKEEISVSWTIVANGHMVHFKTEELAQKAIDILGEETIKLALSTDW